MRATNPVGKRVRISDGRQLRAASRAEAEILAREANHPRDFALPEGACVMDVGANVGIFAIALADSRRDLRMFLIEPIPDLFAMLVRNVGELLRGVDARVFNIALGRANGTATFDFDPFATFATTMRPRDVDAAIRRDATVAQWSAALLDDMPPTGAGARAFARAMRAGLKRPLLAPLVVSTVWLLTRLLRLRSRAARRRITCPVRTLSWLIERERIERIHLLSIDVEGAELEVLAGLSEADWPKIDALVVEVHDVDGRFASLDADLRQRGFDVREQGLALQTPRLLGLRILEAVRPGPRSA